MGPAPHDSLPPGPPHARLTALVEGFGRADVPFWLRAPLAAAIGAVAGKVAALAGLGASIGNLICALLPALAALNIALADLGRRPLSALAFFGTGLAALVLVGCLGGNLAFATALLTTLVGGTVGARLAAPGNLYATRRGVLFVLGAIFCPLATIAAHRFVQATAPGEPLAVGLALFHGVFWLLLAGSEAALTWSAARARPRRPRPALPAPGSETGPDGLPLA